MPAATRKPRSQLRGKQPDPVQPTYNLVSIWDTFGLLFQEIRGRLAADAEPFAQRSAVLVRFDELMHAVPDSQFVRCHTCHQVVMGETMVMKLLVQVLEQAVLRKDA